MVKVLWGGLLLALLAGGAGVGMLIQGRLKEHHRSQNTTDAARAVAVMVVTFAALVLGLLVSSTKADFDEHTSLYRHYGVALIQLDQRLREYGPDSQPIRNELRAYTATVIAVTWPDEPRPSGQYPTDASPIRPGSDETAALTTLMARLEDAIERLVPSDTYHQKLASILEQDVRRVAGDRWGLVERTQSKLSPIFLGVMMWWLVVVFVIFGLTSPRNAVSYFVIGLSALAVASSLYLVIDLDSALGGFIEVPSAPLRDALWHMDNGR